MGMQSNMTYNTSNWERIGNQVLIVSFLFIFIIIMVNLGYYLGALELYQMLIFNIFLIIIFLDSVRFFLNYRNGYKKVFIISNLNSQHFKELILDKLKDQIGAEREGPIYRPFFDHLQLVQAYIIRGNPLKQFTISILTKSKVVFVQLSNNSTNEKDKFDELFSQL